MQGSVIVSTEIRKSKSLIIRLEDFSNDFKMTLLLIY